MKLSKSLFLTAVAALSCFSAPAVSGTRIQSGNSGGLAWQAQSTIVGQNSTATLAAGGNPAYFPSMPAHSGVVALIMDYGAAGAFICSGSLLSDRRSILTAGHCVSSGTDARPLSTTAFFYGGPNPDTVVPFNPASTAVSVSDYFVNALYTGEVIDQNDIAVLRLSDFAPDFATAYDIFDGGDLTGQDFNIAGYGGRSDTGGSIGANLGTGRLRQGDNNYSFRLGDSDFGGFFTDVDPMTGENFFGTASIGYSYLSDFDNGLAANDASCQLAGAFGLGGAKYCNTGVGALEVGTAGGDSGGPQFIDGRISSVTSYGLSFGSGFGDVDNRLNSSWGEFNGFVPTFIHSAFIRSSMVPEPQTWAMMLFGFGLMGYAMRRRRYSVAFA